MRVRRVLVLRRKRKTVITIRLPPLARADLDKFLERLQKALYGETVIGEVEGNVIRLQIYGSKLAIARTLRLVRQLLREYSTPRLPEGAKAYRLQLLSRQAGTALPWDVMVEVLRHKGYEAEVREDKLVTTAPEDEVLAVAVLIASALRSLEHIYATRTAKKLLVALMSLEPGLPLKDAIDYGLLSQALFEDESGKLHVRGDWREALKSVLSAREVRGWE